MKRKYLIWGGLAAAILLFVFILPFYNRIFSPSIRLKADTQEFFVYPGDDYAAVGNRLLQDNVISEPKGFYWMAEQMNYPHNIHPGRYLLKDGMSNRELVQLLRSGKQTPVRYTFVKFRTLEDMAAATDKSFAFTKDDLLSLLKDDNYLARLGFDRASIICIFMPNTYEFYWTATPQEFVEKMLENYKKFWTRQQRNEKCRKLGLNRIEVMTLASIVEEETNHNDEKPTIAGVYLNRIRQGMPLQADPTVKFAAGDFALKRVSGILDTDSPYNTYRYAGIPPGPICTPSPSSIDAVLDASRHAYVYFCAKPDGSGYHSFSETLDEHTNAANAYHRKLDEIGIKAQTKTEASQKANAAAKPADKKVSEPAKPTPNTKSQPTKPQPKAGK